MRGLALAALALLTGAAAPQNVNVSRLPGPQTEPAIAVDPRNPRVLLAGSNSIQEGTMRIYASSDGGTTWQTATTHEAPEKLLESCASDPSVAIDTRGRQYYSYGLAAPCGVDHPQRVFVVTRALPDAAWSKPILVASLGRARLDDKPAITVDNSPVSRFRGRVYVVWTRVQRNASLSVMLSYSDDGAKTWSRPVKVNRTGRGLSYASVAVGRDGSVYVAWDDVGEFALQVSRSLDGGSHFGPEVRVAGFASIWIPHCGAGIVIPALPRTCVNANPIVSVDASGGRYSGRVYVSYGRTEFRGHQAAHVAVFTRTLKRLYRDPDTGEGRPVAPAPRGRRSEQFWVQSVVDQTTGAVWVCYYDTLGDPDRRRAHYTCTASRNGGRTWLKPIRAAAVPSDATQPGAAGGYGYYQGLAAGHGAAYPVWTDTRDLASAGEEIYTTRLTLADFR
jgi:hypothetical protein